FPGHVPPHSPVVIVVGRGPADADATPSDADSPGCRALEGRHYVPGDELLFLQLDRREIAVLTRSEGEVEAHCARHARQPRLQPVHSVALPDGVVAQGQIGGGSVERDLARRYPGAEPLVPPSGATVGDEDLASPLAA